MHFLDLFVSSSDIDECGLNETLCGPHGYCENMLGSFRCLCDQGYQESEDSQACVGKYGCFGGLGVVSGFVLYCIYEMYAIQRQFYLKTKAV